MIIILPILILIFLIFVVALIFLFTIIFSHFKSTFSGAPYIKNDEIVIYESLKLSELEESDTFVDLGSGDGQTLLYAVNYFNVKKAVGYEISFWPYVVSKFKSFFNRNSDRITINNESLFNANLTSYDKVYLYLLPDLLQKLKPKIIKAKEIKPDLKICCPVFEIKGLNPIKTSRLYHAKFKRDVNIYVY